MAGRDAAKILQFPRRADEGPPKPTQAIMEEVATFLLGNPEFLAGVRRSQYVNPRIDVSTQSREQVRAALKKIAEIPEDDDPIAWISWHASLTATLRELRHRYRRAEHKWPHFLAGLLHDVLLFNDPPYDVTQREAFGVGLRALDSSELGRDMLREIRRALQNARFSTSRPGK